MVRLRRDGECRLCTLEQHVKDAHAQKVSGASARRLRNKRSNDWCHGGASALKISRMSNEWRGKLEATQRPRTTIDDHPGYPVNNREQWVKDEAYRERIGVRGYKDDLYAALPGEMRTFLHHHNEHRPRQRVVQVVSGIHDVARALRSVGWHLRVEWRTTGDGLYVQVARAWPGTPRAIDVVDHIQGARERVHQPFFDSLTAGMATTSVQNSVGLFATKNMGGDDA